MDKRKLKIYSPEKISMIEIEALIDRGYRFDIYDGLDEDEYDDVEVFNGKDVLCSDKLQ